MPLGAKAAAIVAAAAAVIFLAPAALASNGVDAGYGETAFADEMAGAGSPQPSLSALTLKLIARVAALR